MECARLARSGACLSLIGIDVDCFKALNDSQGHQRGDECLVMLGVEFMKIARRRIDLVARCGGEEFGVILPETDCRQRRNELLSRCGWQSRISSCRIRPRTLLRFVTVSIGVATATQGSYCTPKDLSDAADRALYAAKRAGRNRVCEACSEAAA